MPSTRSDTTAFRIAALAVLTVVLAMVIACGDSGQPVAAETPSPTPTPTSTPIVDVVGSAEEIDFTDVTVIGPIIDHFGGGEIESRRIQFVDLTGDDRTEAFVIVESGGTAGDVGAALVGIEAGEPQVLGYVEAAGRVELRFPQVGGGVVVTTQGVWEPGDALCCPSSLQEQTWEWQDRGFVLVDEQVVDNPDVDGPDEE